MNLPITIDPIKGDVVDGNGRSLVKYTTRGQPYVHTGNKTLMVRRLIWEHVHGPIPVGAVVHSINGEKTDCRIANLRLSNADYAVDAERGIVYGKRGAPLRNRDRHGYIVVCSGRVRKAREGVKTYAHQTIWEHVHGPIQADLTINHINGVKDDNRISNLELVTQRENMHHAYRTGLIDKVGEAHHLAKLDEEKVAFIRANAHIFMDKEMAAMFGVVSATVRDARNGKNWSHLPGAVRKK